jgi:cysteine synthase
MIHDSITDTIGRTPIVRLGRIAPEHVELYVKIEAFNPGGSVKDRLAIAIILDAEQRGTLEPGQTVIEATSGNTGVALAMICAARGYPFVAVMTETFSIERRKLMRAYGAKVILTPAAARGSGMVERAERLAAKHGWFLARQFDNEANPRWHRNTTGPEILADFAGRRLDWFVSGWGTGGTLTGAGQMIRLARPEVGIVACEPAGAALLSGRDCEEQASIEEVAESTLMCLKSTVPAILPGIVFLSGGQSDEDATAHLDAMNRMGPNPWPLSFSYGRAMQSAALKLWSQDLANNVGKAQDTVYARARDNGLAALGKWTKAA